MNAAEVIEILERVRTWPPELQEKLAEVAEAIEASHLETDAVDEVTRAAIEEGRMQLDRGEVVTELEFAAMFKKYSR